MILSTSVIFVCLYISCKVKNTGLPVCSLATHNMVNVAHRILTKKRWPFFAFFMHGNREIEIEICTCIQSGTWKCFLSSVELLYNRSYYFSLKRMYMFTFIGGKCKTGKFRYIYPPHHKSLNT